jgi:hypothetical protein
MARVDRVAALPIRNPNRAEQPLLRLGWETFVTREECPDVLKSPADLDRLLVTGTRHRTARRLCLAHNFNLAHLLCCSMSRNLDAHSTHLVCRR